MLPANFYKLTLKERYNYLLKEALENYSKPPCDLYKKSKHNAGFTSSSLKKIANHRFDSAEGLANAIDGYVLIHVVPKDAAKEIYELLEVLIQNRPGLNNRQ